MSDELLMDLADCGSPEKLLAVILKHHPDWTAPVPVEELARSVNIIDFRELEGDKATCCSRNIARQSFKDSTGFSPGP
jgi:hypothetical protein